MFRKIHRTLKNPLLNLVVLINMLTMLYLNKENLIYDYNVYCSHNILRLNSRCNTSRPPNTYQELEDQAINLFVLLCLYHIASAAYDKFKDWRASQALRYRQDLSNRLNSRFCDQFQVQKEHFQRIMDAFYSRNLTSFKNEFDKLNALQKSKFLTLLLKLWEPLTETSKVSDDIRNFVLAQSELSANCMRGYKQGAVIGAFKDLPADICKEIDEHLNGAEGRKLAQTCYSASRRAKEEEEKRLSLFFPEKSPTPQQQNLLEPPSQLGDESKPSPR